jgi:hypothetical protein
MFCVTEAEAAAIRAIFQERGEFSAAVELRRLFPGTTSPRQLVSVRSLSVIYSRESDNEERFSLGGAAHDLSARASGRDPRR